MINIYKMSFQIKLIKYNMNFITVDLPKCSVDGKVNFKKPFKVEGIHIPVLECVSSQCHI